MTVLDDEPRAEFVSWRPPPVLRGLVEECHGYRYAGVPPGTHHGLPSSAMTVVIAFEDPLDVGWFGEAHTRGTFWGLASGLHTRPAEIVHHGRQFGIQLGLTVAGARRILGMPMGTLARELVSLDDVLPPGLSGWYDAVAGQPTWRGRFEALDAVLLRLIATTSDATDAAVRPELSWAWGRIEATGGTEPVAAVSDELGWSRRHLHQQFSREFGVSPKSAARIVRFQRAKALFTTQRSGLAEVAARCGYADQSHLTREWRSLAGYSPWQWARAELPYVQDRDRLALSESSHV